MLPTAFYYRNNASSAKYENASPFYAKPDFPRQKHSNRLLYGEDVQIIVYNASVNCNCSTITIHHVFI